MEVKIDFNNSTHILKYNNQNGYFEINTLTAADGGVYEAKIIAIDALGNEITTIREIQILVKPENRIQSEDGVCYILDAETLEIKDIQMLADYTLAQDDETNESSNLIFAKNIKGQDQDYITVKTDKRTYLGIIDSVEQEKDENTYTVKAKYISNIFDEEIFLNNENLIKEVGVEDYIKYKIEEYFSKSNDDLLNKSYIDVIVNTHTKLEKSVDNEDGKYNFHTYITNCKQNYDIDMKYEIVNKRLKIIIEKVVLDPILIDCTVSDITSYKETFEKQITAKVRVKCKDTGNIREYFLNADRHVIEDINNVNRVKGKTVSIVVEEETEAYQSAVDQFKGNSYNFLVEFNLNKNSKLMSEENINIGKLARIKTKSNVILEGYITARTDKKDNNIIEFKAGKIRRQLTKILKQKGGI